MPPKTSVASERARPRAAAEAADAQAIDPGPALSARLRGRADALLRRGVPLDPEAGLNPSLNLTIQMVLAARRWRSLLDDRLRPIGQSAARMEAMSAIAHAPPHSPQIEIARRIGVEGATLTRMLDSLAADGLVERLADPSDRRTKHLRLTEAGRSALAEISAIAEDLRLRLLEDVDAPTIDQANDFLAMLLTRFDVGFPGRNGD
jgi:MarR family transcriptional regulator for hemolysin